MSMIGLLSGAPQTASAKASTEDSAAASGFGSTLQGELDALVQGMEETVAPVAGPGPTLPAAGVSPESTVHGVGSESISGRPSSESAFPLVDLVEAPVSPLPVAELGATQVPNDAPASIGSGAVSAIVANSSESGSTSPATGAPVSASPLTASPLTASPLTASPELVEPRESKARSASTGVPASPAVPPVEPDGTTMRSSTPAPATSATGAPVAAPPAVPQAESGSTPPVLDGAPASLGRATGSQTTPGHLTPASATSTPGADSALPLGVPASAPTANPATRPTVSMTAAAPTPSPGAPTVATASVSTAIPAAPASSATAPSAEAIPAQVPVGVPAAAVPTTAAVAPPAAAAPAPTVPFATQLARPIFSLAAAGPGEHVMTVSVTPDTLGPVTVRAHVGADGVRVELFAPNELGRDAIRAIIPELRRDLAGAGLGGNLTLSSQNQPSADSMSQHSTSSQPGERDDERGTAPRDPASAADTAQAVPEQQVDRSGRFGTISTIDVLA